VAMRPSLPVPSISRRAKIIIGVVVLLVLLLSVLGSLVRLYVDWLWFGEVGYRQVFRTGVRTRLFLFFTVGILMALVIGANIALAYRFRPPFRPVSPEQQNLERYRTALEPRRRLVAILVSGLLGLFAGITAQTKWETWLLWRSGTPFHQTDPQFHKDISYFVYTYPFQRFVLGYLFTAIVLALISALVVHYLFGGLRLQTPGEKVTPAARVHLVILLGLFVLLKAVAYYLDRYGLVFSDRAFFTGASYTDVNAVLPAKTILIIVALICAVAVFANIFLRNVQLPAIAIVLLILTSVVTSGIYPALMQQFTVKPNADQKEQQYISRNIAATRQAYGIQPADDGGPIQTTEYNATSNATIQALAQDKETINNARLLDPNVLSPTFTNLQQIRNFYGFPEKLDIDRYTIRGINGGKPQDYVVGARELVSSSLTAANQQNWINRHLVFTHGNGLVAAAANRGSLKNAADFAEGDLPPSGPIAIDQPRIYYGELLTDYSIVGARQGETAREFDRPGSNDNDNSSTDSNSTYDGAGGVNVGSSLHRLAFAIYYRERNILLSNAVNPTSKIIFNRDPADRVEKVAPFLKVDGDPYPAVVNKRIVWILDGYTTLNGYPYSQHETLGEVSSDSLSGQGTRRLPNQEVNYIRNSVKATVDAYDGTVTLYEFDSNDPVLKTWERVYPGIVKPASDISPELRSHFRYPEDLFKVQRKLLTKYHVTDPVQFFKSQDFWAVPTDPNRDDAGDQPPYYILAQAPGDSAASFQLTSALTSLNRPNLAAYVTVSSDPDDYGKFHVLKLPGSQAVLGPGQVQSKFASTPEISQLVSLLDQHGSRVIFGNLLTLPVAGGLLYIEPMYVAAASNAFPVLQKVLAAFGDEIAFKDKLSDALDTLFGPGAGNNAPDQNAPPPGGGLSTGTPTPTATPSGGASGTPTPTPTAGIPPGGGPNVSAGVTAIDTALADLSAAYQSGDPAKIGDALAALQRAVTEYRKERGATTTPTPATTSSPSG
jgi:uncharacterized membrane protein (UPF0182 family)